MSVPAQNALNSVRYCTDALPLTADELAAALVLTGHPHYPTPAQLAAVLAEQYPHGPTVADLLAAGQLVPTIDKKRLREPPPTPAQLAARQLAKPTPPATGPAMPRFSYFRGGIAATKPYATVTLAQLYEVLTSARFAAATTALRAAPVSSLERAELKKRLDYITPAGTFTRRANNGLAEASGLLVLDFDHLPDVGAARAALLADRLLAPELVLLFTSPSGDGLKALVRTDARAPHGENFRACAAYLAAHYTHLGLVPDEAGKDVARACFVPHAPDAWLAPAYAPAA